MQAWQGGYIQFLAKSPPKPPDFFLGGATEFFLGRAPFFSSTFLRMGSVSSSWSSFCIPPRIQSRIPFSSLLLLLLLPLPLFAAVAAKTLPVAAGPKAMVNEAILILCLWSFLSLQKTGCGSVSVCVYGDPEKPALITYPDLALNYMSCFQGLFFWPEAASLLLHNFCVYHISPPGHELGAATISSKNPVPSVGDLADQIADVLDFFSLDAVMCLGVTAGAYILTLFALKYRERVIGLILVSPLCKTPSWTEWLYNKVMSNVLYYYGMCGVVKEMLLQRYFSKEVRGSAQVPESDIVQACRSLLNERQSANVLWFLQAINGRHDLTERLNKLQCRTLIFVGDSSPFHSEAHHMISKLDRRYSALVEVQACGSMVTEEQPHAMLIPIEYFLLGYGLCRPFQLNGSPRSPLSPSCISRELLSPESMGLKLKPIKTRVSLEV